MTWKAAAQDALEVSADPDRGVVRIEQEDRQSTEPAIVEVNAAFVPQLIHWLDAASRLAGAGAQMDASMSRSAAVQAEADREVTGALRDLVDAMELVFGQNWEHTSDMLEAKPPEYVIGRGGSFLAPRIDDESNNWWNRGALLASYRHAVAVLRAKRAIPQNWPEERE